MKKILIVKLGSTFQSFSQERGDFEDWVIEKSGFRRDFFQIFDAVNSSYFPEISKNAGLILTGSHDMVTDKFDWSERTAKWLAKDAIGKVPVLGICYGHQLLGHALGGVVDYHVGGTEIGTVLLESQQASADDFLFRNLEFPFPVIMSHSQSILQLPRGAVPLAYTKKCENAAFYLPPFTWGIQFHPEFDREIIRRYVERLIAKLLRQGQDPDAILSKIKDTPESSMVLQRFCQFCFNEYGNSESGKK